MAGVTEPRGIIFDAYKTRLLPHLPVSVLGFCAVLACLIQFANALPGFDVPPHWQLSASGAVATILTCGAMLMPRVRDPLGAVILPAIMATFSGTNLLLGQLPEAALPATSLSSAWMPTVPSLLLLLMALCCWRNGQGPVSRRLRQPVATTAIAVGAVLVLAHALPDITGFGEALTSQATVTGALLIMGLGLALTWLRSDPGPRNHRRRWKTERAQKLLLAMDPHGQITEVYVDKAEFLGPRRRSLIGGGFEQVFNEQTLSKTDLGKFRRAYSWANSGRVSVATVITYRMPYSAPRLLDTLIRPTLVDGQVTGMSLCVSDLSTLQSLRERQ